jgi:CheY-like chemotaxis protein
MADSGGGNDYFCSGPDHAPQVFQQEFQGLESVVAQNISVEIRGTDEVVATGLLDEYRVDQVDGGLRIVVGDAYGDEKRSVIARLVLRRVELAGPVKVADVVVRWANVVGDLALHSTTIPVVVGVEEGVDPDRIPVDQDIVERVDVLNIARARREAGDLADRGDTDAALKRLEDAIRIAANRPSMKSTLDDVEREELEVRLHLSEAVRLEELLGASLLIHLRGEGARHHRERFGPLLLEHRGVRRCRHPQEALAEGLESEGRGRALLVGKEREQRLGRDTSLHEVAGSALVDDDDGVRQFAAAALRERGYEVLAFADGEAALRRFDELLADEPQALGRAVAGAPAILVTDVVMPGIDGKELAARVRQLRPALRVLYISGYSDDILTRDGQFDDDIALLEKPFSGDDLAVAVRAVLDSASSR